MAPSGPFRFDALGIGATPVHLREVRLGAEGPYNAALGPLAEAGAVDLRADPIHASGRSGWTNAYLGV